MAVTVKHNKVSAIPDDPGAAAAGEVLPSDWNDSHAITGTLDVTNGGTGASTAAGARSSLLPSYTGNAAKVLAVNAGATDVEWVASGGGGGGATGFEQTFMMMGA